MSNVAAFSKHLRSNPQTREIRSIQYPGTTEQSAIEKTDDTEALKKAIEAASSNGGGIVMVPDGEYRITEALNLGDGVELRGNSGGRHVTQQ